LHEAPHPWVEGEKELAVSTKMMVQWEAEVVGVIGVRFVVEEARLVVVVLRA
jgi:hypothetical protein